MVTQSFEERKNIESTGSITLSVGKKGDIGGEFTVKMKDTDTLEEFEARYNYFKVKLLGEIK